MRFKASLAATVAGLLAVATAVPAQATYLFGATAATPRNALVAAKRNAEGEVVTRRVPVGDGGWYRVRLDNPAVAENAVDNTNYIAGRVDFSNRSEDYRNYFVFGLTDPDLDGFNAETLTLELWLGSSNVAATATYTVYDVTTPTALLTTQRDGAQGRAIFDDLGAGAVYGSYVHEPIYPHDGVAITLNSTAVAAFNGAIANGVPMWAVGGTLRDGGVVVPEPMSLAVFGFGLAGLAALRRRG